MKKVFTAIALFVCMFTNAQEVSIIPQPTSVTKKEGSFSISAKTTLQIKNAGQQKAANFLKTGGSLLINSWSLAEIVFKNPVTRSWSEINGIKFLSDTRLLNGIVIL